MSLTNGGIHRDSSNIDTVLNLLNSDPAYYGSFRPGQRSPEGSTGWYYIKSKTNNSHKIDWNFYEAFSANVEKRSDLSSVWALVKVLSNSALPFITVYTNVEGDGNDFSSYYRSKLVYNYSGAALNVGQEYLFYVGDIPEGFDSLTKVELTLDLGLSEGLQASTEELLTISLSTLGTEPLNAVEFVSSQLGYFTKNKHVFNLVAVSSKGLIQPEISDLQEVMEAGSSAVGLDSFVAVTTSSQIYLRGSGTGEDAGIQLDSNGDFWFWGNNVLNNKFVLNGVDYISLAANEYLELSNKTIAKDVYYPNNFKATVPDILNPPANAFDLDPTKWKTPITCNSNSVSIDLGNPISSSSFTASAYGIEMSSTGEDGVLIGSEIVGRGWQNPSLRAIRISGEEDPGNKGINIIDDTGYGLVGNDFFASNYEDNSYIQKKYFDDNSGFLGSGDTASRPTTAIVGARYFDTTLGYSIDWNGSAWVNATGTVV